MIQFIEDKAAYFRGLYARLAPGAIVATTYRLRNRNPTRADAIATADPISTAMTSAGCAKVRVEDRDFKPPADRVIGATPE